MLVRKVTVALGPGNEYDLFVFGKCSQSHAEGDRNQYCFLYHKCTDRLCGEERLGMSISLKAGKGMKTR